MWRLRTWTCRTGTIRVLVQQQAQVAAPNIWNPILRGPGGGLSNSCGIYRL